MKRSHPSISEPGLPRLFYKCSFRTPRFDLDDILLLSWISFLIQTFILFSSLHSLLFAICSHRAFLIPRLMQVSSTPLCVLITRSGSRVELRTPTPTAYLAIGLHGILNISNIPEVHKDDCKALHVACRIGLLWKIQSSIP